MHKKLNYNIGDIVVRGKSYGVVDGTSNDKDHSFSVLWIRITTPNLECAWFDQETNYLKKVGSIEDYLKLLN